MKRKFQKRKLRKSACSYDCEFNIAVLGSDGVGKTSILNRMAKQVFAEEYIPTTFDIREHCLTVDNIRATFKFHDVTNSSEFELTRRQRILSADGFILVFSMTDRRSFEELEVIKLKIEVLKRMKITDLPVIVIGNKVDIGRVGITNDEILKFCQNEMDSVFLECSAKNEKDLSYICPLVYDELGVSGLLYEKVLAIQCKEEVNKVEQKSIARLSVK